MNISRIEKLINESKLSKQEISNKCGFTRPTLDSALRGADIKISTITALSNFFKVPISYFFDEDSENKDAAVLNELAECRKEIERLNKIISTTASSHVFLAVPIDDSEFIDLRDMKDKVIRILSK